MSKPLALLIVSLLASPAAADPKPGSCEAMAKAAGKKLAVWKVPAGCTVKSSLREPGLLDNEADVRLQLDCKDPKAKPPLGLDFKKQQLVITTRSMSPAQVGLDFLDDGKTITVLDHDRAPCKGDPQPMPGPNSTLVYVVPAGKRAFKETSCTVERKCK